MSCKINYIDDFDVSGYDTATQKLIKKELNSLRDRHIQLVDSLKGSDSLSFKKDGRMWAVGVGIKEAEDFIRDNTVDDARDMLDTSREVFFVRGEKPNIVYVAVNVFNNLSKEQEDLFVPSDVSVDDLVDFGALSSEEVNDFNRVRSDWAESSPEYKDFIQGVTKRFKDTIGKFLSAVGKDTPTVQNLRKTAQLLDTKGGQSLVESIGKFIVESSNTIDALRIKFVRDYSGLSQEEKEDNVYYQLDKLQNSTLTGEERNETLNKLSSLTNSAREYLYLFDELKHYKEQLRLKGFIKQTKGIEFSDTVAKEVEAIIGSSISNNNLVKILGELNNSNYKDFSALAKDVNKALIAFNKNITTKESTAIVNALNKVVPIAKNPTIGLDIAITKSGLLNTDIKNMQFDLAVEFVWGNIQEMQKNKEEKLTRENVIALLKLADTEEGVLKHWFDASVHSNDPILATTAKRIADEIYEIGYNQTLRDAEELESVVEDIKSRGLDIDLMSKEQRDEFYKGMTHLLLEPEYDENKRLQEVENDPQWVLDKKPTLKIKVFGKEIEVKARQTRAFLTEENKALFDQTLKEHKSRSSAIASAIFSKATDEGFDWDILMDELSVDNPYYKRALEDIKHYGKSYYKDNQDRLESDIESSFWRAFADENYEEKTQAQKQQIIDALQIGDLSFESDTLGEEFKKEFWSKPVFTDANDTKRATVQRMRQNKDLILSKGSHVFLKIGDIYQWVDISNDDALEDFEEPIKYFVYSKYDLKKGKYSIESNSFQNASDENSALEKWNALNSDAVKKDYFSALFNMQQSATLRENHNFHRYGYVGQIHEVQQFDGGDAVDKTKNYVKTLFGARFTAWRKGIMEWFGMIMDEEKRQQDNEKIEGKVVKDLDGNDLRKTPFKFTHRVEDNLLEKDLFRSTMALKAASNNRKAIGNVEPQIRILRKVLAGDRILGNEERGSVKNPRDSKLNKKFLAYLDDIVYGMSEKDIIATLPVINKKVNVTQALERMSKYIAINNLAWKVPSMAVNIGVGNIQNYGIAVDEMSTKEWSSAQKEYATYFAKGNFAKDMVTSNIKNKSLIGRLALQWDAFQGEYVDDFGDISRKGSVKDAESRVLMWTMNAAEHQIQTTLMIQQLKSFKVEINGEEKSLWELSQDKDGNFQELPAEVTATQRREFRNKLRNTNSKAHGLYSKINKSMAARTSVGKLFMAYKKYIYPTFASRFQNRQFDWEIGAEKQGYVNTYVQTLFRNVVKDNHTIPQMAFQVVANIARMNLGALDTAFWGKLSSNSDGINNFLYGGMSEDEKRATVRTQLEMGIFLMLYFLTMAVQAAEGDDDDDDLVLKNVELLLRKLQNDVGIYLPFYNVPFASSEIQGAFLFFDNAKKLATNPFAQMRTASNVGDLVSQTVIDTKNLYSGEGMDVYKKSGYSYKKGDLKWANQAEKVLPIVSIWHNIMQLASPQDQLKYLDMVNKTTR